MGFSGIIHARIFLRECSCAKKKSREGASKKWDCPQTEVLGEREEDRVQSWWEHVDHHGV